MIYLIIHKTYMALVILALASVVKLNQAFVTLTTKDDAYL